MRFLRLVLVSIIVFALVIIFLFSLFPKNPSVSRVIKIHGSQEELTRILTDLSNWPAWNQFLAESDEGKIRVSAPSNLPGSTIQKGQLTVRLISSGIDSVLTLWTNSQGRSFSSVFLLMPADKDSTYIQWKFSFHLHWYPWEKLGSMFYERQFGPVMEKSLFNLEDYLGKNP